MLRELRNAVLIGVVIAWLRPRAKRLATCVGVVLFVLYAESEFMSYVQSLPNADPFRGAIKWTLVLKNVVILVAVSVVIVPEIWERVRPSSGSESAGRNDSAKQQGRPIGPAPNDVDDGFGDIRRKDKLRSRIEQILDRKR